MKYTWLSSNLLLSESKQLSSSFLFECTKSFLLNGDHVHFISKTKVGEIPFTIHGATKPSVDAFSQLSLKWFNSVDILLEYACNLLYVKSRPTKYPKAVILQDLEAYFEDEEKGMLSVVMLMDALNALGKAFNSPIYFLAELSGKSPSERILSSVIDNLFSSVWKLTVDKDQGSIVKLSDKLNKREFVDEIKFGIGEKNIFLEAMCKR